MTPKQQAFMSKLLDEKDVPIILEGMACRALERPSDCPTRDASQLIDKLLACPRKAGAGVAKQIEDPIAQCAIPEVPAGRYALADPTRFYQVDRPQRGRYEGWVFLSEVSGDNLRPIKLREAPEEFYGILDAIWWDQIACARRYGHYKRECGYCRKNLTDPFSRFYGVGPVCRRDHGMPISAAAFVREGGPQAEGEWLAWQQEDRGPQEEWDDHKNEFARIEREQENAAYEAKMRRDEALFYEPETPAHLA